MRPFLWCWTPRRELNNTSNCCGSPKSRFAVAHLPKNDSPTATYHGHGLAWHNNHFEKKGGGCAKKGGGILVAVVYSNHPPPDEAMRGEVSRRTPMRRSRRSEEDARRAMLWGETAATRARLYLTRVSSEREALRALPPSPSTSILISCTAVRRADEQGGKAKGPRRPS